MLNKESMEKGCIGVTCFFLFTVGANHVFNWRNFAKDAVQPKELEPFLHPATELQAFYVGSFMIMTGVGLLVKANGDTPQDRKEAMQYWVIPYGMLMSYGQLFKNYTFASDEGGKTGAIAAGMAHVVLTAVSIVTTYGMSGKKKSI